MAKESKTMFQSDAKDDAKTRPNWQALILKIFRVRRPEYCE
jgi:hypothetical protein